MAWTEKELKIFASGLAIGGQWNHVGDSAIPVPNVDPPPGNYFGQIIQVRLWSDIPGAIVRATFDGSIPSATAEPLNPNDLTEIDVTTTVRAFAQLSNKTSKVASYKFDLENPFDATDIIYKAQVAPVILDSEPEICLNMVNIDVADTVNMAKSKLNINDTAVIEL